MPRETFVLESCNMTAVERKIDFAGKIYQPDRSKAYFDAVMCHSLPSVNANGRCMSAATLANSFMTALNQLVDFNHRLAFYAGEKDAEDQICGTIAAIEFPDKEEAIALAEKGKPVPLRGLLVAFRKAKRVEKMIEDIANETANWKTSIETEYKVAESALYTGGKFIPWTDLTDEDKKLVGVGSVGDYKGAKASLALGGADGKVLLSGCAFTRFPADKNATIEQMAASREVIHINAGWKTADDWRQAVATELAPEVVSETAASHSPIVVGQTDAGPDGHSHSILSDMTCMTNGEHDHYARVVSMIAGANGSVEIHGVTSPRGQYNDGKYKEHSHLFTLGGASRSNTGSQETVLKEDEPMARKEHIVWLRAQATALKASNPEIAKGFEAQAVAMEKQEETETVDQVIASKLKEGLIVSKADHESAVAKAKKDGEDAVRNEVAAAAKAAQELADCKAARLKRMTDAKLDVATVTGKGRTLGSDVSEIPMGAEGDKTFERLIEREELAMKSAVASATATDKGAGVRPPVVSSTGSAVKSSALGFL